MRMLQRSLTKYKRQVYYLVTMNMIASSISGFGIFGSSYQLQRVLSKNDLTIELVCPSN